MTKKIEGAKPFRPSGPLTKKVREDRLAFCVSTFANCRTREEQISAIMAYAGIKRVQAMNYLEKARAEIRQTFTEYQLNAAEDAFQFLMDIRQNPHVKPVDRINAQRELRETFQFGNAKKVAITKQVQNQPVFVQNINLAILQNPVALEAALALEESLNASALNLYASPNRADSDRGELEPGATLDIHQPPLDAGDGVEAPAIDCERAAETREDSPVGAVPADGLPGTISE